MELKIKTERGREHTCLADRLLATGKSECVDRELAADGASQLDGDVIRRKGAAVAVSESYPDHFSVAGTDLMSSA